MIFSLQILGAMLGGPAHAQNIIRQDWGTTDNGEKVELFTLKGVRGLEARITNFGGRVVALYVPNAHGGKTDVELGFDDFGSYYRKDNIYGGLVGRYVGRISHGGSFPLNGKIYQLEKKDPAAKFVIHGGAAGFHNKVWTAEMREGEEPSLILTLDSPDGDGGFPGRLATTVTYTVTRNNELKLDYHAEAIGGATIANLTNHSYFALQGEGNGDISDQTLQVFADRYTPADADNLETGEILPVDGTKLDFRKPVLLSDVLHSSFPQIAMRQGLDINMVINGKVGTLRPAARLSDPHTGIVLDVLTTQPCMQLYSDGIGERTVTGKGGKIYRTFYAMSLETQNYLDAVNYPEFPATPSTILVPGEPLHEITVFRFSNG
ncbi:MAG TPA: aldose epimerase family protein [Rhizomicrobium sp.]|nr:aldose epimerase family protein [Rhizomicrobium sp.]